MPSIEGRQQETSRENAADHCSPNEMLGVDIMGPFPRSSQQHEYMIVDYHTRWVESFPMRNATALAVARLL